MISGIGHVPVGAIGNLHVYTKLILVTDIDHFFKHLKGSSKKAPPDLKRKNNKNTEQESLDLHKVGKENFLQDFKIDNQHFEKSLLL